MLNCKLCKHYDDGGFREKRVKLVKEKREKREKKKADDSSTTASPVDTSLKEERRRDESASKSREPSLTRGERERVAEEKERVRGEKDRQRERNDEREDSKKARYSDQARRDDVAAPPPVRLRDREERREREDARKVERDLRASSAASSESDKFVDPSPRRVDERGECHLSLTTVTSRRCLRAPVCDLDSKRRKVESSRAKVSSANGLHLT